MHAACRGFELGSFIKYLKLFFLPRPKIADNADEWSPPLVRLAREVLSDEDVRSRFLSLAESEPLRRNEILSSWLGEIGLFNAGELDTILMELTTSKKFQSLCEWSGQSSGDAFLARSLVEKKFDIDGVENPADSKKDSQRLVS